MWYFRNEQSKLKSVDVLDCEGGPDGVSCCVGFEKRKKAEEDNSLSKRRAQFQWF